MGEVYHHYFKFEWGKDTVYYRLGNWTDAGWHWDSIDCSDCLLLAFIRLIGSGHGEKDFAEQFLDALKDEEDEDTLVAHINRAIKDPGEIQELAYNLLGDNRCFKFGDCFWEVFGDDCFYDPEWCVENYAPYEILSWFGIEDISQLEWSDPIPIDVIKDHSEYTSDDQYEKDLRKEDLSYLTDVFARVEIDCDLGGLLIDRVSREIHLNPVKTVAGLFDQLKSLDIDYEFVLYEISPFGVLMEECSNEFDNAVADAIISSRHIKNKLWKMLKVELYNAFRNREILRNDVPDYEQLKDAMDIFEHKLLWEYDHDYHFDEIISAELEDMPEKIRRVFEEAYSYMLSKPKSEQLSLFK